MKLKAKASLLAGAIALMGVVYIPQASAAVYTLQGSPIEVPGAAGFSYKASSAGAFTGWMNFSLQSQGNLTGTLVTEALPEPEEWAMMLVGVGLIGYQVRRKQKGLRKSALA